MRATEAAGTEAITAVFGWIVAVTTGFVSAAGLTRLP